MYPGKEIMHYVNERVLPESAQGVGTTDEIVSEDDKNGIHVLSTTCTSEKKVGTD